MKLKKKPTLLTILLLISAILVTSNVIDIILDASNRPTFAWEPTVCVIVICALIAGWVTTLYKLARRYFGARKETP